MNHKVLSALLGIILLSGIVMPAIPAFGAISEITATATAIDGATFTALTNPQALATTTIGSDTYLVVVGEGLQLINITTPSNPSAGGTVVDNGSLLLDPPITGLDMVTISGTQYALVATPNDSSLTIIDISTNPSSPSVVATVSDGATYTTMSGALDVDAFTVGSSTYAIVTGVDDGGVQIIDISTPSSPSATGTATNGGGFLLSDPNAVDIVTINDVPYAVVTDNGSNAIQILGLSNPASPADTASFVDSGSLGLEGPEGQNSVTTVKIGSSTYAIVAGTGENAIQIVDISTPSSPSAISTIRENTGLFQLLNGINFVETVTVGDRTYVFAGGGENGFEIIDITNPTNPLKTFSRADGIDGFSLLNTPTHMIPVTISSTKYVILASSGDNGIQIITLKEIVTGADTGEFLQLITDSNSFGKAFSFQMAGVNSTNHIFVANESFHAIAKFNSTGIFISNLGTNGTSGDSSSTFNLPHQVRHDSNDRVLVVDTGNDHVKVFTSTGTSSSFELGPTGTPAGSTWAYPHDVDVDSSNNIYVVDRDANGGIVQKFSSDGSSLLLTLTGGETGATDFNEPLGVAIDSNDRILVAQRAGFDGFQIYDSSGNFVKKVTDADGSGGSFSDPHDIEVDSSDRIYVADSGNNRVQIFDSDGTFLKSLTTGVSALNSPFSVAIDSNGRIVVADYGNQQIVVFQGYGVKIAETEGSSESITVDTAGGSASVQYSETESTTTDTVSLSVTLPSATSGQVTVQTVDEDTVEDGVSLATATDIAAPCTDTCTIQFTVPNAVLTAAGLSSSSASIYHDSSGDEKLQSNEAITTTRDTTTIAGSTIFSGSADFTSKFAVGGVVGTTSAQAIAGARATLGLFGLLNSCDENGFGPGKSLMIYDITYDKCTEQLVKIFADTTCGPMTVKIADAYGISIAGMPSEQPLLNNDTKKVLYTHPIESDLEWFNVMIHDKKDEFSDRIYTNQCTGEFSFTGNTEYTSEQQGINSYGGNITASSTTKLILPDTVVKVMNTTSDTIDEMFNAVLAEPKVDPEPIIPDIESISAELLIDPEPKSIVIDPEPKSIVIDPEPQDTSLWLQSLAEWIEDFIR